MKNEVFVDNSNDVPPLEEDLVAAAIDPPPSEEQTTGASSEMTSQIDNTYVDNFHNLPSHEQDVETTVENESFPFGGFSMGIDSEDKAGKNSSISVWEIKRNRFQGNGKHPTSKSNEEWLHTVHDKFDATRQTRICRVLKVTSDKEIVFLVAGYSELISVSKVMRSILYEEKNETFRDTHEYSTIEDILEHAESSPVRVFISNSLCDCSLIIKGGHEWTANVMEEDLVAILAPEVEVAALDFSIDPISEDSFATVDCGESENPATMPFHKTVDAVAEIVTSLDNLREDSRAGITKARISCKIADKHEEIKLRIGPMYEVTVKDHITLRSGGAAAEGKTVHDLNDLVQFVVGALHAAGYVARLGERNDIVSTTLQTIYSAVIKKFEGFQVADDVKVAWEKVWFTCKRQSLIIQLDPYSKLIRWTTSAVKQGAHRSGYATHLRHLRDAIDAQRALFPSKESLPADTKEFLTSDNRRMLIKMLQLDPKLGLAALWFMTSHGNNDIKPQEDLPFSKWNLPHLTLEFDHAGSFLEILAHSKSIWHYEAAESKLSYTGTHLHAP